jgi:hypothetical protein
MENYYQEHQFETLTEVKLDEQLAVPLGSRSFVVLTANSKERSQKAFLAEVTNDLAVKIDWESDVCYQPVPIEKLTELRPTEPFALRVNAVPDNHYVYEFADPDRFQCLKLTFRDLDEYFFAYVEKGTEDSRELFDYFRRSAVNGKVSPSPMLLSVRFLPDSKGENLLAVENFVAPRWAFVENPADSGDENE